MDSNMVIQRPPSPLPATDSTINIAMGSSEDGERSLRDEPSNTMQENLLFAHESHQATPASPRSYSKDLVHLLSPDENTAAPTAAAAAVVEEIAVSLSAHNEIQSEPNELSRRSDQMGEGREVDTDMETEVCCICLDPFTLVDPAVTTKCQHRFHLQCSECWLQRSRNCPLCWKPLRYEWDAPEMPLVPAPVAAATPRMSTPTPAPPSSARHSHLRHRDSITPHRTVVTFGSFLCKIGSTLWKQLNYTVDLDDASQLEQQET